MGAVIIGMHPNDVIKMEGLLWESKNGSKMNWK